MSVERSPKQVVKDKWPRSFCLNESGMFYVYGNPARDHTFGTRLKDWRWRIGEDMLSCGETELEAWQEAAKEIRL